MKFRLIYPPAYLIFINLFILLIAVSSCKKDTNSSLLHIQQPINNFDKGIAFQEDFDHIVTDWPYYNTDTVSTNIVKFIALDSPVISYQWNMGGATYSGREVSLTFPAVYLVSNKQLPVTLSIGYKSEEGFDITRTFVKTLTFSNPCESKFNGIFSGSLDNANHKDSFRISTCENDRLHTDKGFYLENFQESCGRYFDELPDSYEIGYKQILFSGAGNWICKAPSGIINRFGDSVIISYRSFDNGFLEAPQDHIFKGIKK